MLCRKCGQQMKRGSSTSEYCKNEECLFFGILVSIGIATDFPPIPLPLHTKIGMLRQWLNENRIDDPKKFVTNKDLETWLK